MIFTAFWIGFLFGVLFRDVETGEQKEKTRAVREAERIVATTEN